MKLSVFSPLARTVLLLLLFHGTAIEGQNQFPRTQSHERSVQEGVSLSGIVTNALSGQPIPGASVYLPDAKRGSITDANGEYLIHNLAKGYYLIEVSSVGYASHTDRINLTNDTRLHFSLEPSILESEPIIVTGVSTATRIKRTPTPVTIVNKKALSSTISTNLIDALSKNPGISQITTGPSVSKPVIRGLGYNRVVVLNDGIRQEGQQWGDEHGIEIDEYSAQKVEILKGPASLIYGSDAMAGVINILTNTSAPEGKIKGEITGNYQSNNRLYGAGGNLAGNDGHLNWNIYGSLKTAGDYSNAYDGRVLNSRYQEKNGGGYIGYNGNWGFSHLILSTFNQSVGLITGERDELTGKFTHQIAENGTEFTRIARSEDYKMRTPGIPWQQIHHFKVALENRLNIGPGKLDLNVGYQRNARKEYGQVLAPEKPDLFFDLHTLTYRGQYLLPEWSGWQVALGLNGMQQVNDNKAEEALIPAYRLFDLGSYVYLQKNYNRFTVSGGIRFDYRYLRSKEYTEDGDIKFEAFNRSFSNLSGSAGISYEAAKSLTLKLNIARGFRAPSIAELASNGAHEGTNRYEYGASNLRSETSMQIDQGIELHTSHLSLSVSGFINSIDHFIFYRKLESVFGGDSIIVHDDDRLMAFQFNQAKAFLYGAECNMDLHPHPLDWLHFENTFSYVRGVFKEPIEGVRNLPLIPAARWLTQFRGEFFRQGKSLKNVSISVELDNNFTQNKAFTAYRTETITPGYSLVNFSVSTDMQKNRQKLFTFLFTINNLTDVAYQNHMSRLKYTDINPLTGREGVYNMGRNFSFKILVPLSFELKYHQPQG